MNPLHIATCNSKGIGVGKIQYINELMRNHDMLFIQEHWQKPALLSVLSESLPGVEAHGVSALNDTELLTGRPHGGTAILWNSALNLCITPVSTESHRLCAVKVAKPTGELLFLAISVYMPTDSAAHHAEYEDVLREISRLCAAEGDDRILLGGDWNTDLSRTTRHTTSLKRFTEEENLCCTREYPSLDFTFEDSEGPRSDIDHFFMSDNLTTSLPRCRILHDASNFSDHAVVSINLSLNANRRESPAQNPRMKLKWEEATKEQLRGYQSCLSRFIQDTSAQQEESAPDDLERLHSTIVDCCVKASVQAIPKTRNGKPRFAGWNSNVRPHRETALFWNAICGRPAQGPIAMIRRRTRALYHRGVKQVKANSDALTSARMAHALQENKSRDLWKEVKKMKRSSKGLPSTIDGSCDEGSIADVFAQKYRTMYNGVSYDDRGLAAIRETLDECINGCL